MPQYELKLYKKVAPGSSKHALIDTIPFSATTDDDAIAMAPEVGIPTFDDSDLAMLVGPNGQTLWDLKADRI